MFGGNYDCDGIKWYCCEIKDETKLTETAKLSVNGRDKSGGGWRVKILNRNVKRNNSVQC